MSSSVAAARVTKFKNSAMRFSIVVVLGALSSAGCVGVSYKPSYNLDEIKQNSWAGKQCWDFISNERGVICDVHSESSDSEERCTEIEETYRLLTAPKKVEKAVKAAWKASKKDEKSAEELESIAMMTRLFIFDDNKPQMHIQKNYNAETTTCEVLFLSDINLWECDNVNPDVTLACQKLQRAARVEWVPILQGMAEEDVPVEGAPTEETPISED